MEKSKVALISLFAFTFLCAALILIRPPQIGGDIIEYVGITQTLSSHASLDLRPDDKKAIKEAIGPIYQENSEYYLEGGNGKRYPTHFPLYSIMSLPFKLVLHVFQANELASFSLLNLTILFLTGLYALKSYKEESQKIPFLIFLLASPILFFITWPGPELILICLLLVGLLLLQQGKKTPGLLAMILASWQSQPLLLIPLSLLLAFTLKEHKEHGLNLKRLLGFGFLLAIPNLYYFIIFKSPTAFAKLAGFGLQNFTLQKPFELFLDPNFGLFFYAPILTILGILGIFTYRKKGLLLPFLILCLATATLYTTITNWNHGAPGFGPNRYSIFLLPFLVTLATPFVAKSRWKDHLLSLFLGFQIPILLFNGLLFPNYNDSFGHSPFAKAVLAQAPSLYSPTPEIFIERTVGRESGGSLETAIYFDHNRCKKAYVFKIDAEKVRETCGYIPQSDIDLLTNEFLKPSNSTRIFTARAATIYPEGINCEENVTLCLNTVEDVVKKTGVKDATRITASTVVKGAWVIAWGLPQAIILPPHYIAQFAELEGRYINY